MYKIGITEAGDAGIDRSWANRLDEVDGTILITKNAALDFRALAAANREKLIVHITCTGYGGTVVEPHVPPVFEQLKNAQDLIKRGFPWDKIVIRVDPIIPTEKGIDRALDVMKLFMDNGFSRYRISVLDMYPHVSKRFREAGLPAPYLFGAPEEAMRKTDKMLAAAKAYWDDFSGGLRIESCAEPGLTETIQCGCVSAYDLELLGLHQENVDSLGPQRESCMCYSGKTELLKNKRQCPHRCLYCYWH